MKEQIFVMENRRRGRSRRIMPENSNQSQEQSAERAIPVTISTPTTEARSEMPAMPGTRRNASPERSQPMEECTGLSFSNYLNSLPPPVETIIMPNFDGDKCEISIENWIDRFEELTKGRNLSDQQKIIMIGNYLKDEALDWYMSVRKHHDSITFEKLRSLFLNRFALKLVAPVLEFSRHKYDSSKGVLEYYKNKRRLGTLAGLSEDHIVSFMIDGLPPFLAAAFVAIEPQSMDDFLRIATKAEANFKQREARNSNQSNLKRSHHKMHSNTGSSMPKPPSPCRICENLGYKNRFHWANDCRNRNQSFKRPKIENSNEKFSTKSLN